MFEKNQATNYSFFEAILTLGTSYEVYFRLITRHNGINFLRLV